MDSTRHWEAKRDEELRAAWKARRRRDTDKPSSWDDLRIQCLVIVCLSMPLVALMAFPQVHAGAIWGRRACRDASLFITIPFYLRFVKKNCGWDHEREVHRKTIVGTFSGSSGFRAELTSSCCANPHKLFSYRFSHGQVH
jgi:hypothetical protein